jgi:hypothetical protein
MSALFSSHVALLMIFSKYWEHCGIPNEEYGLFDPRKHICPPFLNQTERKSNCVASSAGAVPPITGGFFPSAPPPVPTSSTEPAAAAPTIPAPIVTPTSVTTSSPSPVADPPPPPIASASQPSIENQNPPPPTTSLPPTPVVPPQPSSISIITVVGANTIIAQPDTPNIVLPNGSTVGVGSQVTLTEGLETPAVVLVGASGIYISNDNVAVTQHTNPVDLGHIAPTPVQNTPGNVPALLPIATVAGEPVSAAAGASIVVIHSQTVTFGGSPVTLPGTNVVATLGAAGLVVQSEGGAASVYTLPVAGPAVTGSIIGTVNGAALTIIPGGNLVSVGTQIVVLGGPLVTLSSHEVLSLGSSGVVVQVPGGRVQTFPLPTIASATSLTTTSGGPGVFIANSESPISCAIKLKPNV